MIGKVRRKIGIELQDQDHEIVANFAFCEGCRWRGSRIDPGLRVSISYVEDDN